MEIDEVPGPLRDRLGPEATGGLLQAMARTIQESRDDMISACTDRFERRLVEEIAGVRVEMAHLEASLRQDMAEMGASIRRETAEMGASIRQDMAEMGASIRQDMAQMGASLRQDIASGRVEILKWCFLFWIGQVLAIASIMGLMLRLTRP